MLGRGGLVTCWPHGSENVPGSLGCLLTDWWLVDIREYNPSLSLSLPIHIYI